MNDIIDSYKRAKDIANRVLINVSQLAAELGFDYPVSVTYAVFAKCIASGPGDSGQNPHNRLAGLLDELRVVLRTAGKHTILVTYVDGVSRDGKPPQQIQLVAECVRGDDWKPVITVREAHED